jgi:hypothetical protein
VSAYREADYQPPCAVCGELSIWSCQRCNEPRCEDDLPEYGPWCEVCEERFGEHVAAEGLYMVPAGPKRGSPGRPAYWRWYHDGWRQGVPIANALLAATSFLAFMEGAVIAGGLLGIAAMSLASVSLRAVFETPDAHLERRLVEARRRFLEAEPPRELTEGSRR